ERAFAVAVAAYPPPPSISPASFPEPAKLNVTLFPPLAVLMKSCVMKSNAGAVFDAARKVVAAGWADAEPAPTPTATGAKPTIGPTATTSLGNESFFKKPVSLSESGPTSCRRGQDSRA